MGRDKAVRSTEALDPPVMPTIKEFVELSNAKASMFCASVLRLARFTVWVFPSLMAMVKVLVFKIAVSVWLSVPVFAKSAKLIVWLVPLVMPTVKEFVALSKAKASMFCASVLRLDKFTVWVFPSLIAMVRVLVFRLAVRVWLSVLLFPVMFVDCPIGNHACVNALKAYSLLFS